MTSRAPPSYRNIAHQIECRQPYTSLLRQNNFSSHTLWYSGLQYFQAASTSGSGKVKIWRISRPTNEQSAMTVNKYRLSHALIDNCCLMQTISCLMPTAKCEQLHTMNHSKKKDRKHGHIVEATKFLMGGGWRASTEDVNNMTSFSRRNGGSTLST